MSLPVSHPMRRKCSRLIAYAALIMVVFSIYFFITNFGGFAWTGCFLGSLLLFMAANVVSHPPLPQHAEER